MPTLAEIVAALDRFAPADTAAEWDNVGLLLGDPAAPVNRLMTCLTLTSDVAAEAVSAHVDLVVTHHPILFKGAKRLTADRGDGRVIWPLSRAGVAVYSPHTAFDNCPGGINDSLCRRLGIASPVPLRPGAGRAAVKLVVFVPDSDLDRLSTALFAAGAGRIGKYRECSFRLAGKGTFFAEPGSNPTVGEVGRREDVDEWRLEVVLPETAVTGAVRAMRQSHSYEEPAFDLYPLTPLPSGGEGRVGDLSAPIALGEFARAVRAGLGADAVQVVGEDTRMVRRVAVACGAAGEFRGDAVRAEADVFLTGEMRFHDLLAARDAGLAVVLPGHYATERPAVEELAAMLANDWPGVEAWASRVERDPVRVIT